MSKFTKIASVLALTLGVSAVAQAAEGDTSTITNLRWIADLTTQVTDGNMVVVDANGTIIGNQTEFELRGVQGDLSIVEEGTTGLFAKQFTDADGDDIAQQAEVDQDIDVSATWALTAAKYEVRDVVTGTLFDTLVEPTITFNATPMTVDPAAADETISGETSIQIGISSAAPAITDENYAPEHVSEAIVTLSLVATQDA